MRKNASSTTRRRKAGAAGSNASKSGGKRAGSTDWARVDRTTDADIEREVAGDPDAAPIFTDEMFAEAQWLEPTKRTPITIKLEAEVLAFYKAGGRGYQTRMQKVLRALMEQSHRRHGRE
jgi:uncharacterized protein (DUF4415 family)